MGDHFLLMFAYLVQFKLLTIYSFTIQLRSLLRSLSLSVKEAFMSRKRRWSDEAETTVHNLIPALFILLPFLSGNLDSEGGLYPEISRGSVLKPEKLRHFQPRKKHLACEEYRLKWCPFRGSMFTQLCDPTMPYRSRLALLADILKPFMMVSMKQLGIRNWGFLAK